MRCPHCDSLNADGATYCVVCARRLAGADVAPTKGGPVREAPDKHDQPAIAGSAAESSAGPAGPPEPIRLVEPYRPPGGYAAAQSLAGSTQAAEPEVPTSDGAAPSFVGASQGQMAVAPPSTGLAVAAAISGVGAAALMTLGVILATLGVVRESEATAGVGVIVAGLALLGSLLGLGLGAVALLNAGTTERPRGRRDAMLGVASGGLGLVLCCVLGALVQRMTP